jgi:hypothetical protein
MYHTLRYAGLELEIEYTPAVRATREDPREPLEIHSIDVNDVFDAYEAISTLGLDVDEALIQVVDEASIEQTVLDTIDPADLFVPVAELMEEEGVNA